MSGAVSLAIAYFPVLSGLSGFFFLGTVFFASVVATGFGSGAGIGDEIVEEEAAEAPALTEDTQPVVTRPAVEPSPTRPPPTKPTRPAKPGKSK